MKTFKIVCVNFHVKNRVALPVVRQIGVCYAICIDFGRV